MKQLFTYLLLLFSIASNAQNVVLKSFDVLSDGQHVFVSWTIEAGSTCNGTRIFRSADDNNYEEVGRIEGICGNLSEPASYSFTDTAPLVNQRAYYKLRLGQIQFTDARSIFFVDATTDYTLYPNPASQSARILFANDKDTYSFSLYDLSGRAIQQQQGIKGNEVVVSRNSLPAGFYLFTLVGNTGKTISGKLLFMD